MKTSFLTIFFFMMIMTQSLFAATISVDIPWACKKVVNYFMAEGNFGFWEDVNGGVFDQIAVNQPKHKVFSLYRPGEAIISIMSRQNACAVTLTKTSLIDGVQINKEKGAVYEGSVLIEATFKLEALGRLVGNGTAIIKTGNSSGAALAFEGDFREIETITRVNLEYEAVSLVKDLISRIQF